MAYQAYDITKYAFQEADELLLDANVWLFLHGPSSPQDPRTRIYSSAFHRMLSSQSALYIDILISAEFANRYARIQHNLAKAADPNIPENFKDFRRTTAWATVVKDVGAALNQVWKHPSRCEDTFCSINLTNLIVEFAKGNSDFNDLLLEDLCRKEGLKLVTDDADFRGRDLTIISANHKLLI